MKNFKKFAVALVVIVLVLFIGLAFRKYWGPLAYSFVEWICTRFGVTPPEALKNILNVNNLGVGATNETTESPYT